MATIASGRMVGLCLMASAFFPLAAQDDVTTRNAASGYNGGFITGPASNPLSFLNGNKYRTFASTSPYLLPDFRPATRLDARLPPWISFGVEERLRLESSHDLKLNAADSYLVERFRLQVNLRFADWFKVVAQTQDGRPVWQRLPNGPPNEVRWDLKLAYVELGDPEAGWVSLRAGRQLLNLNNTILANSEWRNQGRSYDAVTLDLHHDRYRLDIFAASIVTPLASGISHHQAGNNVYGLYGRIDRAIPRATFEPFVLWRVQPSVAVETTSSRKTGRQDEKAYGARLKGLAPASLEYSYEAILERGSDGPNGIRAWGQTFGVARRFDAIHAKPRAFVQYDYASGDANPNDGKHGAFDTMYPTAHDRFGIMDQFGWQNLVAARAGVTVEPRRRWTVTAQYLNFWLASASDALYNSSGGSIFRDVTGRAGAHVGEEYDVYTWFELNRHVNIGAGLGHFAPGAFLANAARGSAYHYPYFAINFKDAGVTRTR